MAINIHQRACFEYLKKINEYYVRPGLTLNKYAQPPYGELFDVLERMKYLFKKNVNFIENIDTYSQIYTAFHKAAEKVAVYEMKDKKRREDVTLDGLFLTIFENNNKINEIVFEKIVGKQKNLTESEINSQLADKTSNTNRLDPRNPDNPANQFFKGMLAVGGHDTTKIFNIPYVNPQEVTGDPIHLRIGAQTQGEQGVVNPTFKRYLLANARASRSDEPYQYVYINLLKRPQMEVGLVNKGLKKAAKDSFVTKIEGKRANSLEKLNNDKQLKSAVITLPADNDFLLKNYSLKKGKPKNDEKESVDQLFKKLAESIIYNKNDFFIPDDVLQKLFFPGENNRLLLNLKGSSNQYMVGNELNQLFKGKLGQLFKKAVKDVTGKEMVKFDDRTYFSPEERTAILFHFTKFYLTEHIVNTLKPRACNISCKDGIDRGAMHTLWYQMNRRYENNQPMTENEFLRYMDSPAMVVKYRALNHNRNLLWNVLNERIKHDHKFAIAHPWTAQWLVNNDPVHKAPLQKLESEPKQIMRKKVMFGGSPTPVEKPKAPPVPPRRPIRPKRGNE